MRIWRVLRQKANLTSALLEYENVLYHYYLTLVKSDLLETFSERMGEKKITYL